MTPTPPPFQGYTTMPGGISEVRYSYREIMQELRAERGAAVYSMEKLDQTEIAKLFKAKKARRDKDKR